MNWLNKIDEILDRFLPPPSTSESTDDFAGENTDRQEDVQKHLSEQLNSLISVPSIPRTSIPSAIDDRRIQNKEFKSVGLNVNTLQGSSYKGLPGTIKTKRRPRPIELTKGMHPDEDLPTIPVKNNAIPNETETGDVHSETSLSNSSLQPIATIYSVGIFQEAPSQHTYALDTSNTFLPSSQRDNEELSSFTLNPELVEEKFLLNSRFSPSDSPTPSSSILPSNLSLQVEARDLPTFNIEDTVAQNDSSTLILSIKGIQNDQQNEPKNVPIESTFVRHESLSSTFSHPYSSSENMFDAKDSASIAYEFVRSQAQSLRAAMGDLDYVFEQTNGEHDGDDDSASNITDEEGEDYNYGDHIIPWIAELESSSSIHDNGSTSSQSSYLNTTSPELITFHPSMNCHGVFHIRLIRSQHIPCTPKSTIQTIISLPPWKGKIKTQLGQTYKGPSKAGTCFRWDGHSPMHGDSEDLACFSMIHTYNNEETPMPSIFIQVKDLSYPMFEKDLFSLTLSCKPLMKTPYKWRKRWCVADSHKSGDDSKRKIGKIDPNVFKDDACMGAADPIILLEAVFEPTNFSNAHPKSIQLPEYNPTTLAQDELNQVCESPARRSSAFSEASSVSSSPVTSTIMRKGLSSKPHLFRIMSMWKPGYCGVCSVTTGLWNRYYQCEICGLDCCSDCQLRVDLELPCGSEAAERTVSKARQSKITVRRVMAILAPIREEDHVKNSDLVDKQGVQNKTIGTLKLKVHRAVLFQKTFSAEVDVVNMYKMRDRWSRVGDYYIRISWSDGNGDNKRTKAVFQTSSPIFESDEMAIPVKTYASEYLIEAIDANTDKAVGSTLLTTQGILQWQRDQSVSSEGVQSHVFSYPVKAPTIKRTLELRIPWKHGFGLDFYKTGKVNDTNQAGK